MLGKFSIDNYSFLLTTDRKMAQDQLFWNQKYHFFGYSFTAIWVTVNNSVCQTKSFHYFQAHFATHISWRDHQKISLLELDILCLINLMSDMNKRLKRMNGPSTAHLLQSSLSPVSGALHLSNLLQSGFCLKYLSQTTLVKISDISMLPNLVYASCPPCTFALRILLLPPSCIW